MADEGPPRRRIVLGSGEVPDLAEGEDRPADKEDVFFCGLPEGRSDCQSIPCCCLS